MRDRIVALRLSAEEGRQLERLVEAVNHRAEEHGVPAEATPSSVIRNLIQRACESMEVEPTLTTKAAPNVMAAARRLREGRR